MKKGNCMSRPARPSQYYTQTGSATCRLIHPPVDSQFWHIERIEPSSVAHPALPTTMPLGEKHYCRQKKRSEKNCPFHPLTIIRDASTNTVVVGETGSELLFSAWLTGGARYQTNTNPPSSPPAKASWRRWQSAITTGATREPLQKQMTANGIDRCFGRHSTSRKNTTSEVSAIFHLRQIQNNSPKVVSNTDVGMIVKTKIFYYAKKYFFKTQMHKCLC